MTVRETVNASKERYGAADLKAVFRDATRIVVAQGKRVVSLVPGKDSAADIARLALGPTGNLRAPAIRTGRTWLIGFDEDSYLERFG